MFLYFYLLPSEFLFCPRLNTGSRSGSFGTIFNQANPNTVYESIFEENMDNSSFQTLKGMFKKTITLPRQAMLYFQDEVAAFSEKACKVSHY